MIYSLFCLFYITHVNVKMFRWIIFVDGVLVFSAKVIPLLLREAKDNSALPKIYTTTNLHRPKRAISQTDRSLNTPIEAAVHRHTRENNALQMFLMTGDCEASDGDDHYTPSWL